MFQGANRTMTLAFNDYDEVSVIDYSQQRHRPQNISSAHSSCKAKTSSGLSACLRVIRRIPRGFDHCLPTVEMSPACRRLTADTQLMERRTINILRRLPLVKRYQPANDLKPFSLLQSELS
jgi:hypothetical protein